MLPINRVIVALCIMTSSLSMNAMVDVKTIKDSEFSTIILHHSDDTGFSVASPQGFIPIQRCYMDQELRGISSEKLSKLLTTGAYLAVKKLDKSDDHILRIKGRLNGGGIVIGKAAYWITKVGGYIGIGIACVVHPSTTAELPHLKEAVDVAAHAAEAIGTIIPGP